MAAAAPSTLASDLYREAGNWENFNPDYNAITTAINGAANRNIVARQLLNLSTRTPVAIATVLTGMPDHIFVLHSPSVYPEDLTNATAFDNHMVFLLGNDLRNSIPIVLDDSLGQAVNARAHTRDHILGPNLMGANPPVMRAGPHGAGTADTNELTMRRILLLPPSQAHAFLAGHPSGRYSLQGFYTQFLQAEVAAGGDRAATAETAVNWWRLACTDATGNADTVPNVAQITSVDPIETAALNQWATNVREGQLARLGVGGTQLTTVGFNAGITNLRQTLEQNTDRQLQQARENATKTVSDAHGLTITQALYNLCDVDRDEDLPLIHGLLANSSKHRATAILESHLQRRTLETNLPTDANNMPLLSTKILSQVFRNFRLANSGQTFGEGLTPFAIVCEGHAEAEIVRQKLKKAEIVETGGVATLQDAEVMTTVDVRMPTHPQQAVEKLYGFSVYVDLFHGENHPVAVNIRNFAHRMTSLLHSIHNTSPTTRIGMSRVCSVLYELQQDYFTWVITVSRQNVNRQAPPTFVHILDAVSSHRTQILADIPVHWEQLLHPPTPQQATRPRVREASQSVANTHADARLVKRFKQSGHTSIKTLTEGHDVTIPKHQGQEVCMIWGLKGECSPSCRRCAQHVAYPDSVNKALHALLTKCGVAQLQD